MERLELVIRKTRHVPLPAGCGGDGSAAARQLDAALMDAGWKLSAELLSAMSSADPGAVLDLGVRILAVVGQETGDHVRHNVYFRDFPANVPDTAEFWLERVTEALLVSGAPAALAEQMSAGPLNLLSLPGYGTYQHSWEEMIAAHGEFIPAASGRLTILHLGRALDEEVRALYLSLAGSRVPLSDDDSAILGELAMDCIAGPQPEVIPVRENRALINRVRLAARVPLLADTVTDVLRLAAALSDGDLSLATPAKLRSFTRPERRILLAALDAVVAANEAKLGDVNQYREQWKRLGERLHPHEHPQAPRAAAVFAVARGEKRAPSLASRAEAAFADGDAGLAAGILRAAPGMLFRSADRLLRTATTASERALVCSAAEESAPKASARVLLSLREHLQNRVRPSDVSRVFASRSGRASVAPDNRPPLDPAMVDAISRIADNEIARRLSFGGPVLADQAVRSVALPLSGKVMPDGMGIMPRGSYAMVDGEILRFFCYWRQRERRTDYDLSAVMLDEHYGSAEHVSWTHYHAGGYATYSGDLTDATDGATEFIDIRLPAVTRKMILPQVYIYAGEGFDQAQESFFGWMTRAALQSGAPFEARTVRSKSGMRGGGRIALPVAFIRGEDGRWRAKWLHLYLKGHPAFNQVEGGRVSASMLTRAIVEREYLTVGWLLDLAAAHGAEVGRWDGTVPEKPVTFIGIEQPEGLPEGSRVITLQNLGDLIPE